MARVDGVLPQDREGIGGSPTKPSGGASGREHFKPGQIRRRSARSADWPRLRQFAIPLRPSKQA